MSKNIDYSNTIIYRIYCKDEQIKDVYVGHTTNFMKRKYSHKIYSSNEIHTEKLYKCIRENGGWNNWDMEEIAKYNCKDLNEARIKEQYHYELLNASLNSIPPYVDKSKYYCNLCNKQYYTEKCYNKHIETNLHNNEKSTDNNLTHNTIENNHVSYGCICCNFNTNKKTDYMRHIATIKHINLFSKINDNNSNEISENNDSNKIPKNIKLKCEFCNKTYNDRTGLWRHKKKCNIESQSQKETQESEESKERIHVYDNDFIDYLIKENNDLKIMIMKFLENGSKIK